jgi:hypothetical protein
VPESRCRTKKPPDARCQTTDVVLAERLVWRLAAYGLFAPVWAR